METVICQRAEYWVEQEGFWSAVPSNRVLPPIIKIEVPVDQAWDVLQLLDKEGVTLAHVMPSFGGVVQALDMIRDLKFRPAESIRN